jgi:hypothetical protein
VAESSQTCARLRCTRQYPMLKLAPLTNRPLSRKTQRVASIIHRTVRCAPDCLVSQPRPRQRSAAQLAGNAWTSLTVGRPHRTIRCATTVVAATVDNTISGRRMDLANSRKAAPDCPVCRADCPVYR